MTNKKKVLGFDPGLGRCGWAVVTVAGSAQHLDGSGCIVTPARTLVSLRLVELFNHIKKLVKKYAPEAMAVEELYFNKNVTTGMIVSQARGVILLVAGQYNLPVFELSPTAVKQSLTGYGRADKRQMQQMVKILLGLQDLPAGDDEADAIAVALAGAYRPRYSQT